MGQDAWAPFSQALSRQLLPGYPQLFLLSEGADKGTPMLLGDGTPLELGEQYE
jgi:hypothetical protein